MTEAVMNEEQQIAAGGRLWFKKNRNGRTDIGFTGSFLELVHECWHISPATTDAVRENMPLFAVESNEALFSVPSPVTGHILFFNDSALNFPDKLKQDDIICTLGAAPEKKKVYAPLYSHDDLSAAISALNMGEAIPNQWSTTTTVTAERRTEPPRPVRPNGEAAPAEARNIVRSHLRTGTAIPENVLAMSGWTVHDLPPGARISTGRLSANGMAQVFMDDTEEQG